MQKAVSVKGDEYEIPMHVDEIVIGEAEMQPRVEIATSPDDLGDPMIWTLLWQLHVLQHGVQR